MIGAWRKADVLRAVPPFGMALVGLGLAVTAGTTWLVRPTRVTAGSGSNPDAACVGCHRKIYEKYEKTPMARASGVATAGLIEGGFTHGASGVTYRVYTSEGKDWLSYERTEASARPLSGKHELEYFIGSNHRGRTYLYREGQQWFEAPINYYSKRALWDMAPNYGKSTVMPAPLPVDANCLHCHATGVAESLPQARNAFADAPFAQGGIGCAACHGDAREHVASGGKAAIINPAKLPVARRDSACLQCHLEGDATVYRVGKSLAAFRAGDDLADDAVYFVKASREAGGGRASSQWEALLRSACKLAVGDKMTCTTCHDAHGSPAPEKRIAWFRAKCVACHSGPEIAVRHHPEQQDCAACHMPTHDATDISHEQATDHNIQKRPASGSLRFASLETTEELLPVGGVKAGDRETGLAYAQIAGPGDRVMGVKAQRLLKASAADDPVAHTQLGYLDQRSGDMAGAAQEYAAALREDSYQTTALTNLAVLDATSGHVTESLNLLERVIAADPSKTAAGMNLVFLQCSLGRKAAAIEVLNRLARVNPDDPALRNFRDTGLYAGHRCTLADGDVSH